MITTLEEPPRESLLAGASAFSSQSEKTVAYKVIQREIRRYAEIIRAAEEMIHTLKSRHNSLSNVSRLPSEILVRIFSFVVDAYDIRRGSASSEPTSEEPDFRKRYFNSPQWVTMGHVCKEWRQLLMDTPCLWSRPYFGLPRASREMLSRAGGIPITAHVSFFNHELSSEDKEEEELVFQNLYRTTELDITEPRFPSETGHRRRASDIACYLQRPAPLMQILRLRSRILTSENYLPPNLFSGEHPRLRSLTLNNWMLRWEESYIRPLSNLTYLSLHQTPATATSSVLRCRPSQFVSALRLFHNLQHLSCRHYILDPEEQDPVQLEACNSVILKNLQIIDLEEAPRALLFILDCISVPTLTGCQVSIAPTFGPSVRQSKTPLGDVMQVIIRKYPDPLIWMHLERLRDKATAIALRDTRHSRLTPSAARGPQVTIVHPGRVDLYDPSLIYLLPCINDFKIISTYASVNRNAWMSLSRSRSLETFILGRETGLRDFLEILSLPSIQDESSEGAKDGESSEYIPFFCLNTVHLFRINFAQSDENGTGQVQFEQLAECIKLRRQRGLGPRSVFLVSCKNAPGGQLKT